jgi:hypothetical protein
MNFPDLIMRRKEVIDECRKLHNEELYKLWTCCSSNITRTMIRENKTRGICSRNERQQPFEVEARLME